HCNFSPNFCETAVGKMSADGSTFAFASTDNVLVPGANPTGSQLIFVHGPDPSNLVNDLTGDGDLNDMVLGMMDSTQVSPSVVSLCPADQVSLAAGVAAVLRPESAGATPTLSNCPAGTAVNGGVDLNGNGTARDEVVHFESNSTTILNLSRAATAVSLSG